MTHYAFPDGFVWGAATAAYQIEGAHDADGKGESIWDRFSHTPGKVLNGDTGDDAVQHYTRYADDIALMRQLGLNAYRFSVSWPRVLPNGRGPVNNPGLDFYDRLVDGLLAAGITPWLTLYHWDLPQVLQDEGGWTARSTAEAFVEYASAVASRLGDRVRHWSTHNEPWCASFLSYHLGHHAPGLHDLAQAIVAAHHLLLSHGWAVPVIRQLSAGSQVGITLNQWPVEPASASSADYHAMRQLDGDQNRWFLDPLYGRDYPADIVREYQDAGVWPDSGRFIQSADLATIAVPTDFLGVNYYGRHIARADVADNLPATNIASPEHTEMGEMWEIHPAGLFKLLMRLHYDYQPGPIYIHENGASFSTGPGSDGRVRDTRRLAYIRDHLIEAHRAIEAGAPLRGYFVWSLLDNFEWALGYSQRFGIVHVDYETQVRTIKDSGYWYADVIASNAVAR